MRLELAQTFAVGSDASNGRFPPVCVRQDSAHPTAILYLIMLDYLFRLNYRIFSGQ